MGFEIKDLQMDCRFFSGYKPCSLNDKCNAQCPAKQIAHPRILIIHLEALGAVLRGTALLLAIKRKWPQAHVTWITSRSAAPLLESNHLIDRILKNDHQGALALSTLAFDYGFCVDKSLVAAGLLQVPLEVKERRGFGALVSGGIIPLNTEAQRSFELGLSNHEKFFVNKKPEIQLIIESLGLDFQNDEYVLDFSKKDLLELEAAKRNIFGLKEFDQPVIGLNTGCSPTIPYKKFSVSGWVDLVDLLRRDFPRARILLLGGPEDTLRNEEIKAARPGSCVLTPTTSGLRSGLHHVNLCDVVVTGDSLGMHMAIALKKWVVAWFGPTCAHEIDLYERGVAIKTSAPCSPCWKRECDKPVMCYDQVDFEAVSKAVRLGLGPDKVFAPAAKKIPEISL